jgi:fatty-acyl-CoA synthase
MKPVPISSDNIVGPIEWLPDNLPPKSQTLPELLEDMADLQPNSPALVSAEKRLTYKELADKAKVFAAGLQEIGVKPGTRIAILAPNIEEWVVSAFAALRFGTEVELFNTWALAWDLEYLLSASKAEILITVPKVRSTDILGELNKFMPEIWNSNSNTISSEKYPNLKKLVIIGDDLGATELPSASINYEQVLELGSGKEAPMNLATGNGAAYVMYTSGTTERPKAVPLKHREMIENGFSIGSRMGLSNIDRVWLNSPLFWSFGGANAAIATMTHGACLVLQEIFTPKSAAKVLADENCTAAYLLPSAVLALANEVGEEIRAIESLRTGLTIGRPEEVRQAVVDLGITQICNVYGSTEVYGNCCVTPHDLPLEERLICQGPPLQGVELRVVDLETNEVLPINRSGELQVRGRVMAGYIGDPTATKSAITEDGWYKSGDTGLLRENGTFQFIARHSDMIKTSGINVSPLEVEGFIMSHDSVLEVVVVGAEHPSRGEVPVAFVVLKNDAQVEAKELQDFCKKGIASFKVPAIFEILDVLPKTTTGKTIRKSLVLQANELVKNNLKKEK